MKSKTHEALELANNGMSVVDAAAKVGVPVGSVYSLRANLKKKNTNTEAPVRRRRRRIKPESIALNAISSVAAHVTGQVFAFYGNANDVANVVRSLQ